MNTATKVAGAMRLHAAAQAVRAAVNWVDRNATQIINGIKLGLVVIGIALSVLAKDLLAGTEDELEPA